MIEIRCVIWARFATDQSPIHRSKHDAGERVLHLLRDRQRHSVQTI